MDDTKLKKLGAELEKARIRQAEWTAKVKELERRYKEAENTCIHDMVHAADLTPEELADFLLEIKGAPITTEREEEPADDNDEET